MRTLASASLLLAALLLGPLGPAAATELSIGGRIKDVTSLGLDPEFLPQNAPDRGRPSSEVGPSASKLQRRPTYAVGNHRLTRWERVKEVIQDMLEAYSQQDISKFMGQYTEETQQDLQILRNAVLNDYQVETAINVEVILSQYWVTFDRVCIRVRWNRSATQIETGIPRVETGEGLWCFLRHDDYRMLLMSGSIPFGRSDPQLQKQVTAGQPNVGFGGVPVSFDSLPLLLELDFVPGGAGNAAFVDFEDAVNPVRKLETSNPLAETPQTGEDLLVYVTLGIFPSSIQLRALGSARVGNCGYPSSVTLDQLREVRSAGLGVSSNTLPGPSFGVVTSQGNSVLIRVPDTSLASYYLGPSSVVNAEGSLPCP